MYISRNKPEIFQCGRRCQYYLTPTDIASALVVLSKFLLSLDASIISDDVGWISFTTAALENTVSQHCECAYMYACKHFGVESD